MINVNLDYIIYISVYFGASKRMILIMSTIFLW